MYENAICKQIIISACIFAGTHGRAKIFLSAISIYTIFYIDKQAMKYIYIAEQDHSLFCMCIKNTVPPEVFYEDKGLITSTFFILNFILFYFMR